jgi:hypothetical protein
MRTQDVKIGEYYRHSDHPNYCWAKVIGKLKPHEAPNTHGYAIFKCEWSTEKDDRFGLIKYFKAADLVKGGEQ